MLWKVRLFYIHLFNLLLIIFINHISKVFEIKLLANIGSIVLVNLPRLIGLFKSLTFTKSSTAEVTFINQKFLVM